MSKALHSATNTQTLSGRQDEIGQLGNFGSELAWYKNSGLLRLNFALSAIFIGQCLGGYDGSLVSGFQALSFWKAAMGHPSSSAIGVLNAAVYISALVTSPFARYVADNYGRRYCIWYNACTNLLGTVLGCAAGTSGTSGYGMFIASRIVVSLRPLTYYYTSILKLVGITNTGQVTGINAGLTTFTFIAGVCGLWLTQKINRRPQLALSWSITLCANVGLTVSSWHYATHKDSSGEGFFCLEVFDPSERNDDLDDYREALSLLFDGERTAFSSGNMAEVGGVDDKKNAVDVDVKESDLESN
ncbi:hypothetical protein P7C70_g128, partial [Phenoliferia sp. Uapishka_3]